MNDALAGPWCLAARSDPALDGAVAEDVARIRDALVALRPKRLLVLGSFGRGEGRVQAGAKGRPRYQSDMEIAAYFGPRRVPQARLDEALTSIRRDSGLDVKAYPTSPLRFWGRHLPLTRYRVDRPLRSTVDFWNGHRSLYGPAPRVDVDARRIPRWEAIRLLGNRCGEALDGGADSLGKLAVAAADALLIARGQYTVRWVDRVQRLEGAGDEGAATVAGPARAALEQATQGKPFRLQRSDVEDGVEAAWSEAAAGASLADWRAPRTHTGPTTRKGWDATLRSRLGEPTQAVARRLHPDRPGLEWRIYTACIGAWLAAPDGDDELHAAWRRMLGG